MIRLIARCGRRVILMMAMANVGCAENQAPGDSEAAWEAYRAEHLISETPSGPVYAVDDMLLGEIDLRANFDERYGDLHQHLDGDAVGRATGELIADAPFGTISWRESPTIDYCFSAPSTWGQLAGNDIDGYYTAPALAPVMAAIDKAAQRWGGVANIRFRHRTDLDGDGCGVGLRYSGDIQFWVGHWDGAWGGPGSTGTAANAPVPSVPDDFQVLLVPPAGSGFNVALAIHELGHVLGFRHEHERDDATPQCGDHRAYAELTEFDPGSVMMYADCTVSMAIIGLPNPSRLDGIGARMVYGPPHWWWGGLL